MLAGFRWKQFSQKRLKFIERYMTALLS